MDGGRFIWTSEIRETREQPGELWIAVVIALSLSLIGLAMLDGSATANVAMTAVLLG